MQFTDGSVHQLLILKIAILQTEYFSKPCQNPMFSNIENTEKNFEEGSSRGAFPDSCEKRLPSVNTEGRCTRIGLLAFYPRVSAAFSSSPVFRVRLFPPWVPCQKGTFPPSTPWATTNTLTLSQLAAPLVNNL